MTYNNYANNPYLNNRASTPNPAPRQNFQAPPNIQVRKPGGNITIVKNVRPQVVIETGGMGHSNGPQIERANSPVISISRNYNSVNQPQSIPSMNSGNIQMGVSSLGSGPQITLNQSSGNISIVKNTGQAQIAITSQPPKPIQPPPSNNTNINTPQPQIPQSDTFHRLSLLSFVSTFEDEKSFNETDLEVLGLDLKCQEPLLPMLHSVLSDAPLLDHSRHPMPECYSKIQSGKPTEKLSLFSPQTLLFIFYTYPRDNLQVQAAAELNKRNWVFDEEAEEWRDPEGNPWSVDQWREFEENQGNELGNM